MNVDLSLFDDDADLFADEQRESKLSSDNLSPEYEVESPFALSEMAVEQDRSPADDDLENYLVNEPRLPIYPDEPSSPVYTENNENQAPTRRSKRQVRAPRTLDEEGYEEYERPEKARAIRVQSSYQRQSPKYIDDVEDSFGNKCMSKAAISARENREKKKQLMQSLQHRVNVLSAENSALKKNDVTMRHEVTSLRREVAYLRGVLANQSTLSTLLKSVVRTPGIKLQSALMVDTVGSDVTAEDEEVDVDSDAQSDDSGVVAAKRLRMDSSESDLSVTETKEGRLEVVTQRHARVVRPAAGTRLSGKQKAAPVQDHDYLCKNGVPGNPIAAHARQPRRPVVSRLQASNRKSAVQSRGVCLHVTGSRVSLEFCPTCGDNAVNTQEI